MTLVIKDPSESRTFVDSTITDKRMQPVGVVTRKASKVNTSSPLGMTMNRSTYSYASPRKVATGSTSAGDTIFSDLLVTEGLTVTLAFDPHRTRAEAELLLDSQLAELSDPNSPVREFFLNF